MKALLLLLYIFCIGLKSSLSGATPIKPLTPLQTLKQSSWKEKLESQITKDPDYQLQKSSLEISDYKLSHSFYFWTPNLQVYGSQTATPDTPKLTQTQLGLAAQLNLFQFGRDYYLLQSHRAHFESQQLALTAALINIENSYLNLIFKGVSLSKKVALYLEIAELKLNTLKVAQQRFERGNLARQQLDKISIDLANFESQKLNLEKELNENQLLLRKYKLDDFQKIWPFSELKDFNFSQLPSEANLDLKKQEWEVTESAAAYQSVKAQFWPSLDLTGRYYKFTENSDLPNQWDLTLTLSWKIWDRFSDRISASEAYKSYHYSDSKFQQLKSIYIQQGETAFKQLQLSQSRLKKSITSLSKLNSLYQDTEKLFSQGRITVNELFQDQQLLLETKINMENDILDFHQSVLSYCQQKSQRVWDCIDPL